MIFTRDLLFVHVPKTGGLSATGYLLDVLPRPVWLSHPIWDASLPARGVVQIDGRRHETLAEAAAITARRGLPVERFAAILATIRNPYDLEVSRWAYLRQGHQWERGPEQELALASPFEEFAVKNEQRGGGWATAALARFDGGAPLVGTTRDRRRRPGELREFYEIDGRIPGNLRLLRFEHLAEDLAEALRELGVDTGAAPFPWVNRSARGDYRAYYTPAAEAAVYRRYRWVFDRGLYPRIAPLMGASGEARPCAGSRIGRAEEAGLAALG